MAESQLWGPESRSSLARPRPLSFLIPQPPGGGGIRAIAETQALKLWEGLWSQGVPGRLVQLLLF